MIVGQESWVSNVQICKVSAVVVPGKYTAIYLGKALRHSNSVGCLSRTGRFCDFGNDLGNEIASSSASEASRIDGVGTARNAEKSRDWVQGCYF
jgi:hypothetical protein